MIDGLKEFTHAYQTAFANSSKDDIGQIELPEKLKIALVEFFTINIPVIQNPGVASSICMEAIRPILILHSAAKTHTALELLLTVWQLLGKIQYQKGQNIACGIIEFWIAYFYNESGDEGAATWWALHTYADDWRFSDDTGSIVFWMRDNLGIGGNVRAKIQQIYTECFDELADNSKFLIYPEEIVRRLATYYPEFNYLFTRVSKEAEYPLNDSYFARLLDAVKNEAVDRKRNRGKALELLVSYLFLLVPGFVPQVNIHAEDNVFETDTLIRNLYSSSNVMSEIFGRYFLAECKNRIEPIGTADVGYFLFRLQLAHASFGVLFSRMGLTGSRKNKKGEFLDPKAATALIRRAFHESKITCIVIKLSDLERLSNKETTFRALLFELSEQFRFGYASSASSDS